MTVLVIKFSEILSNDNGDGLTVVSIGEPINGGKAVLDLTARTITYTPPLLAPLDSFTYKIKDRLNQTSVATIHITIVGNVPAMIKANDDEITRPYPNTYPYHVLIDGRTLLANDTGANISILSVGNATKHQTKGRAFYDPGSGFIRYIPADEDTGGTIAPRYPKVGFTVTQTGTSYGTIEMNGAGDSIRMTPVVGQTLLMSVIMNTPQTGKPVIQFPDAWLPVAEASNPILHARLFYRDIDAAFVSQYNASGNRFILGGSYLFDGSNDTFFDVEIFQIEPSPGGTLDGSFNGGSIDLLQFGAFGGNPEGSIPSPIENYPVLWHRKILLFNENLERPTGSPLVYPGVRPGIAEYSNTDYTNAAGAWSSSVAIRADYAVVVGWSWRTPVATEAEVLPEDYFGYTIIDNAGATSSADVHIILTNTPKAIDDNFNLPAQTRYNIVTGSVQLTGHSNFYDLGYRGTGSINVLGYVLNYDVTELRQDMEGIIGPINNSNVLPGVFLKVVDPFGVQIPDNHDFGYLRIYRETPLTDAEVASLPPLLFGTTTRGQSNDGPPAVISYSELMQNDEGRGITVKSFTQPAHGRVTQLEDASGILYTRPTNRVETDTFTYTITNSRDQTSTANVTLTESTVVVPPPPQVFPRASNDSIQLQGTHVFSPRISIPIDQLLSNDTYEGANVDIQFDFSRNGAETYREGNFFVYIPPSPPVDDLISYTITDFRGRTSAAVINFIAPTTTPDGGSSIGGLPGTNVRQTKSIVGTGVGQRMILPSAPVMQSLLVAFMPQFDVTNVAGGWYNAKTDIAAVRDNAAIATKSILLANDTAPELYIWDYTPTEETVTVFEITSPKGDGPSQGYFTNVDLNYEFERRHVLDADEILIGVAIGLGGNLPTVEGAVLLPTTAGGPRATVQPFFSNETTTVKIRVPTTQNPQRMLFMSARIKVNKP